MTPKLFLAPMAGVNNIAFRLLCKQYGCDIVSTEMVSAHALALNKKAGLELVKVDKAEHPVSIQLFGLNVQHIIKAAKFVEDKFDYIDFNFGCPAPKIFNQGMGAALLNRPAKVGEIINKLVKHCTKPITAKIRAGISSSNINCVKIAKIIEQNGASMITVHARTSRQGYAGKANWQWIKDVKDNVNIPVIGNGDIFSGKAAVDMLEQTDCDHLMIGRGAIGNPHIFNKIKNTIEGKHTTSLTIMQKKQIFFDWYELYKKHCNFQLAELRFNAQWFTKSFDGAKKLRDKLSKAKAEKDIMEIIEKHI